VHENKNHFRCCIFGVRKCCSANIMTNILHFALFVEFHSCFFLVEERNIKVLTNKNNSDRLGCKISKTNLSSFGLYTATTVMCFTVKNI
jgi:hypothetical protein